MFKKSLFSQEEQKPQWIKKNIDGFNMNLNPYDGGISAALWQHGIREKAFMGLLQNTVTEGMTCLDLGGNIGYTTLYMCRGVGKTGKVYAVEPDPNNIGLLRANIADNGYSEKCEITQCAISSENKTLEFWQADKPNLSSVHQTKHSTGKIEVQAYSIETFFENRDFPNFIKMDVEGHEVSIFQGGLNYFSNNADDHTSILLEVHPHFYSKENDFEEILKSYFEIGFIPRFTVATPVPQPQLFKEAGYSPLTSIWTDGFHRGVYGEISPDDLLRFACRENIEGTSKKIVRSFMLSRG
ncbi:FkbM family methyltransferase [bacterium]|nr:FkbM family methyltransferase [bacterium]